MMVKTTILAPDGSIIDVIDAADPTPPVPVAVSRRQAKLALLSAGKLEDANNAVLEAGIEAQINWNDAMEFRRDNPLITAIGGALGMTSGQIDDLFRLAITL